MRNSFAENYDKGMKMLIKISKNPNAKLYSDIEEKGKGKRLKKPNKHFNESDKENQSVKKRTSCTVNVTAATINSKNNKYVQLIASKSVIA